ncbi:hypothetical protein [Marinagarivorans cellulosilyticus]|uniref:Uncharacterized protein n=1 Tax=Marinagarivorans cellulosilyticus TaxID=2721545 RepID=A0AAN1WEQ2_9GAMM|nr:hypothetical protein [Marinagarivorans cellulosilyticus]BCD96239.1 hypothetical protein MARGE09_P0438 [Marinagarivorans cellulosilyticus]
MGLQPVASQSVVISYSGPSDFTAKHAAVIGDQSAAGNITHTRYDNTAIDVDYPTSFEMLAKGQEGEQVTVSLGDAFDVNAPIVAGYYMNTAYGVSLADETGLSTLYFEDMATAADTRLGAGKSFSFINNATSDSKLWGDGISQLNKATELGFSIEVKRNATVTADIVDLGQGALRLRQVGSELEASVRTGAGTAVVSLPMPLDEWMQAAVHYNCALTGVLDYSLKPKVQGGDDLEVCYAFDSAGVVRAIAELNKIDGDYFVDRQRARLIEEIKDEVSQLSDDELSEQINELLKKTGMAND